MARYIVITTSLVTGVTKSTHRIIAYLAFK